jgi:hypothetical protein
MKTRTVHAALATIGLLAAATSAVAYDADWKRGRVYYRSVCTACHVSSPVGSINPSSRAKLEWTAYLAADKHAKGKDKVSTYLSKTYRNSVKATNKAAEKFLDVPEQELADDLKAFLIKGAKDGDAPASCS